MEFGLHISTSGGLSKAPKKAKDLGCDCLQLFVSNPRSWIKPDPDKEEIDGFIKNREELCISSVTAHVTYLPNLASPERSKRSRSIEHMLLQYQLSAQLQADFFVIHPGSHKGAGLEKGTKNIAAGLNKIFKKVKKGPVLLLENTAGAGDSIGSTPKEFKLIVDNIDFPDRIAVCLDTCHAYAAGENISVKGNFAKLISRFEKELFKGCVKLIHANDCKTDLASKSDRHMHIGHGSIGKDGFKNILSCRKTRNLPVILETPVDEECDDIGNLKAIRSLY
ncbi:MAG: deoxyribonuclease IV [Planctomycetota bacterium]